MTTGLPPRPEAAGSRRPRCSLQRTRTTHCAGICDLMAVNYLASRVSCGKRRPERIQVRGCPLRRGRTRAYWLYIFRRRISAAMSTLVGLSALRLSTREP